MYTNDDLEAAVAAGALSPEAANALRDYVADRRATPIVDEEQFRLLTGFNDIFVGVAAVILLIAVAWIGNSIRPGIGPDELSPFSGLFIAGSAWGLAEFFTRKRRMALPSIILLLAFVGGVFAMAGGIASMIFSGGVHSDNETVVLLIVAGCAAIAAVGAWLHWRRFKVPITIAAGAGAVAGLFLALLATIFRDAEHSHQIMLAFLLLAGIGMFLVAMWWDASDPRRETRRSDVAFWLHLLAAPMIVHPIFALLGLTDGEATIPEAVVVLVVYVGLGLTALAIDRRAFLVSALAYVLWALTNLFERFQVVELSFALTALLIGSALLLLSAFWHDARRAVVRTCRPISGASCQSSTAGPSRTRPDAPKSSETRQGMARFRWERAIPLSIGWASAPDELQETALDGREDGAEFVAPLEDGAMFADERPRALALVQGGPFLDLAFRMIRRAPEGPEGGIVATEIDRIILPQAGGDHPPVKVNDPPEFRAIESDLRR